MPTKSAKKAVETADRGVKPVRRRLSPAERRIQIIEAARALFCEGGLALVSMRNIARRVGITQAAIYQHFEDKDAILFAIAEEFFTRLIEDGMEKSNEEADPIARLKRGLRGYIEVGLSRPDEYRLVFMTNVPGFKRRGMHRVPPGEEAPVELTKGKIAYAFLQEQVRDLIGSGLLCKGDPEVVAEAVWAAIHGIVSLILTHLDFPWAREELIETQLRILFDGLLPDGSPSRGKVQAASPKA